MLSLFISYIRLLLWAFFFSTIGLALFSAQAKNHKKTIEETLSAGETRLKAQIPDQQMRPVHGIAMHGRVALDDDFTHFPYVNPDAPQGGDIIYAEQGGFDSLNPFIVKGQPVWVMRGLVYESLMARGKNEPFSLYGRIAQKVSLPDDRSSITFHLDPDAHFHDGEKITTEDVAFSMQLLRDHGRPNFRSAYQRIQHVEILSEHDIRFIFKDGSDRELPLIIALMPVLPSHGVTKEAFQQTSLSPLLGSGPYQVREVKAGSRIVFEKDPNYWGRNKPFAVGHFNAKRVLYDYFRDRSTLFESFKKGFIDVLPESDPSRWSEPYPYTHPNKNSVIKAEFGNGLPKSPSAFVFNTRKELFKDVRVRQALALLFDFKWINNALYFNLYQRTAGFFDGSALSSMGQEASPLEKELLKKSNLAIKPQIYSGDSVLPLSNGSGRDRSLIRQALSLLKQAGWRLEEGILKNEQDAPFRFTFLATTRDQERLALAYQNMLRNIGVDMAIRSVDSAHYQERLRQFDYDMIHFTWRQSLSPGNEQYGRWSTQSAFHEGSFNMAGVRDKGVDHAIDTLLAQTHRDQFTKAVRGLDRLLINGFYIIPLFHTPKDWVAHWAHIQHPQTQPLLGYDRDAWWVIPEKQRTFSQ